MTMNKRFCGGYYERIAASYLEGYGYEILEYNYHAGRSGEVDLIAYQRSDRTIVFVEVKYRSSARYGHPAEAVDRRKQETIRHCAAEYLRTHRERYYQGIRFDVVALLGTEVLHYVDAF